MIKSRGGVTIVELIMVIVVVGILAGGLSLGIIETVNLWSFLSFNNEIASQGRIALMRMGREIRQITTSENPILTADIAHLEFIMIGENGSDVTIDYQLSGTDLMRDTDILTNYVSNLTFTYYDKNNTSPVTDPSQIYRIAIALTLRNSSGSQTLNLNSQIFPRNLGE